MNVHAAAMTAKKLDPSKAWVAAIKKNSGLSWERLGEKVGLSHTTLSRAADPNKPPPNFRADTVKKLITAGGLPPPSELSIIPDGMAENDAAPYEGAPERTLTSNQTIWIATTGVMVPRGILPGDRFILDQGAQPGNYDIVLATVADLQRGSAETIMRVYFKEFLMLPGLAPDEPVHYVDKNAVVVMGVIKESWRTYD
jgi:hypothetical protein